MNWFDRKSGRSGTYDHREPGQAARLESYVVACKTCNSKRGDKPDADERIPLLPAPAHPHYSPSTIKWLKGHGVDVEANTGDSESAPYSSVRNATCRESRESVSSVAERTSAAAGTDESVHKTAE